jgi:hypothetical protein
MINSSLKSIVSIFAVAAVSAGHAAVISQTNLNPGAAVGWNDASVWGGNAVVGTNDYTSVAGASTGTAFAAGGTTWSVLGTVRDVGSSTFNGGSLIMNSGSRLLMKGATGGGAASSVNLVLNGGFIQAAPNQGGTAILGGTINAQGALNAIGTNPFSGSTLTLNINSTITGSGTIQFVNAGDTGGSRTSHININGDISLFSGKFYLSSSTSNNNVAVGSDFSILNSAPLATLEMATSTTNFLYNLNSNITFASVIIGGQTLAPGVYNASALNGIAAGKFFDAGGSITVVPEPSVSMLCGIGLGVIGLGYGRRGRRATR